MSNVAGKAYGMNVVTPMRPCLTWINRALFMASRAIPKSLKGLLGLPSSISRWVIIKRNQWPDLGQGKQSLKNDATCCSAAISTERGTSISTPFPTAFRAGSTCCGIQHEISPFDPDHPVQELHPGEPDRHRLLLQFRSRAPRSAIIKALRVRPSRSLATAYASLSPRISRQQYVTALVRGAERPRLSGLCPDRERRYGQRGPESRTLRCKSGEPSAHVKGPHIVRPRNQRCRHSMEDTIS